MTPFLSPRPIFTSREARWRYDEVRGMWRGPSTRLEVNTFSTSLKAWLEVADTSAEDVALHAAELGVEIR